MKGIAESHSSHQKFQSINALDRYSSSTPEIKNIEDSPDVPRTLQVSRKDQVVKLDQEFDYEDEDEEDENHQLCPINNPNPNPESRGNLDLPQNDEKKKQLVNEAMNTLPNINSGNIVYHPIASHDIRGKQKN